MSPASTRCRRACSFSSKRIFSRGDQLPQIFFNPHLVQAVEIIADLLHDLPGLCDLEQHALDVRVAAILAPERSAFSDADRLEARELASHLERRPGALQVRCASIARVQFANHAFSVSDACDCKLQSQQALRPRSLVFLQFVHASSQEVYRDMLVRTGTISVFLNKSLRSSGVGLELRSARPPKQRAGVRNRAGRDRRGSHRARPNWRRLDSTMPRRCRA